MREDIAYWLAFARFGRFGPVRMQKLARRFASMQKAFEANATSLLEAGIEPDVAHRFLQERFHLNPESELDRVKKENVHVITLLDPEYPPLLKTLYDPPSILHIRGTLPDPAQKHLAVVGSRKATGYGKDVVRLLIEPLAASGVVIVSGLAYGIDAFAHQAALDAGGTTVAVLGSGVDHDSIYPSANRALASQILAHKGAIISEFPLGTNPLKQHFPIRNRILAGMCQGTLVIEAAIKSGSLITARAALESGRDVYAVPGSIHSPLSEGPNNLIKMGAIPVTKPSDIYAMATDPLISSASKYQPANEEEKEILEPLAHSSRHIDELVRLTKKEPSVIARTITMLEMKGAIRHDGGQYYSKV
jgi:DNA processing protein